MHAAGDYARLVTAIRRAIISPTSVFIGRVSFPRIDGPMFSSTGEEFGRVIDRLARVIHGFIFADEGKRTRTVHLAHGMDTRFSRSC